MDEFTRAYIEAALWSSNDESDESGGQPLDANYGPDDISVETMGRIIEDCERFQRDNAFTLRAYYKALPLGRNGNREWTVEEQAGHDFWLSRNGHGAGFFDRDVPRTVRDRLQEQARKCGEIDLYVGDDGLIYS